MDYKTHLFTKIQLKKGRGNNGQKKKTVGGAGGPNPNTEITGEQNC